MSDDITPKRGPGRPPNVAPAPEAIATVAVRVARDFWNENEIRVRAGAVIEVSVKAALKGIKSGALEPIED